MAPSLPSGGRALVLVVTLSLISGCSAKPVPPSTPNNVPVPPPVSNSVTTDSTNMNGVEFADVVSAKDLGCDAPLVEATTEELEKAPIFLRMASAPKGYQPVDVTGDRCGTKVANFLRVYQEAQGQQIAIARWTTRSHVRPSTPPEPLTVSKCPAVRVGDNIVMADSLGTTEIQARSGAPYSDVLLFAALVCEALTGGE